MRSIPVTAEEFMIFLEKRVPEPLHGPLTDPAQVLWDRAQRSLIVSLRAEYDRSRFRREP